MQGRFGLDDDTLQVSRGDGEEKFVRSAWIVIAGEISGNRWKSMRIDGNAMKSRFSCGWKLLFWLLGEISAKACLRSRFWVHDDNLHSSYSMVMLNLYLHVLMTDLDSQGELFQHVI